MRRILGLLVLMAFSKEALADGHQVECFERGAKVPILSYSIAGAPSLRLASQISYDNQTLSFGQVAQYKTTSRELYFVADDPATSSFPVLRFESESEGHHYREKVYEGKISVFLNSVRTDVKRVKCRLRAI